MGLLQYINLLLCTSIVVTSQTVYYSGQYFSGSGGNDAGEWLQILDIARSQLSPNPYLQDISMLYTTTWNGFGMYKLFT